MNYLMAIALIRTIVEGIKKAFPSLSEYVLKAVVAALSAGAVLGYGLNAAQEFGLQSRYLILDYAVSTAALWFAVMLGHDIFGALSVQYRRARAKGQDEGAVPPSPPASRVP